MDKSRAASFIISPSTSSIISSTTSFETPFIMRSPKTLTAKSVFAFSISCFLSLTSNCLLNSASSNSLVFRLMLSSSCWCLFSSCFCCSCSLTKRIFSASTSSFNRSFFKASCCKTKSSLSFKIFASSSNRAASNAWRFRSYSSSISISFNFRSGILSDFGTSWTTKDSKGREEVMFNISSWADPGFTCLYIKLTSLLFRGVTLLRRSTSSVDSERSIDKGFRQSSNVLFKISSSVSLCMSSSKVVSKVCLACSASGHI